MEDNKNKIKQKKPWKSRLDHHPAFVRLMRTAAENEILVKNDLTRPGHCALFFLGPDGKGITRTVELAEVGKTIQRILDMRKGGNQ